MLCPKVWDLKAPKNHNEIVHWAKQEVPITISNHYYNHSVSVVLPRSNLPKNIANEILEDSDYYKIEGLPVWEIVNKEFVEAFVKKGELTLLSINTKIDLDNCISVTPKGELILSLTLKDYQKLGIEGRASYFDRSRSSRYGSGYPTPGKL